MYFLGFGYQKLTKTPYFRNSALDEAYMLVKSEDPIENLIRSKMSTIWNLRTFMNVYPKYRCYVQ